MHTTCCLAWYVSTITLKRNLLQQLLQTSAQQKCKYNAIMRNTSMFLIIEWILSFSLYQWVKATLIWKLLGALLGAAERKFIPISFVYWLLPCGTTVDGTTRGSFCMLNTTSHQTLPLSSFGFFRCVPEMWAACLYSNESQSPATALAAWPCMCIYAGCFWLAQSQWNDYHISASSALWPVLWYLWCVGPYSQCLTMYTIVFFC